MNRNGKLALKLGAITVAMFGFGFAMVPIYDVFCEITGLNGKTGRAEIAEAAALRADESRTVAVELLASLNQSMNWEFVPAVSRVTVHPGEMKTVYYRVKNRHDRAVAGQAVPSVTPGAAAAHFKKVECFCFTRQELEAFEERDMPVRFYVAPDLPAHVHTISLSYTFFDVTETAADGAAARDQTG